MKRVLGTLLVVVTALGALVAAGCGSEKDKNGNAKTSTGGSSTVNLTQGSNLTFAMVTHRSRMNSFG